MGSTLSILKNTSVKSIRVDPSLIIRAAILPFSNYFYILRNFFDLQKSCGDMTASLFTLHPASPTINTSHYHIVFVKTEKQTLEHYYELVTELHLDFTSFCPSMPIFLSESRPGHHFAPTCHVFPSLLFL